MHPRLRVPPIVVDSHPDASLRLNRLRLDGNDLILHWIDGLEARHHPRDLRIACPCAHCVSEVTGKRILDPATIADDLTLRDVQPVGNYAYRMLFADGHDSGIYTLSLLRTLGEQGDGA